MSNENKNDATSTKKVSYSIKTMDSDLKNEGFSASSLDLTKDSISNIPTPQAPEKLKESSELTEKIEPKKSFSNPFLKDLPLDSSKVYNSPQINNAPTSSKNAFKMNPPVTPVAKKPTSQNTKELDEENTSTNGKLLFILFFVSLITVGAGIYYFYFIRPNSQQNVIEEQLETTTPITTDTKLKLPAVLTEAKTINFTPSDTLFSLLLKEKALLQPKSSLYYQIKKDGVELSPSELLSALDIQFAEEALVEIEKSWVSLYIQDNLLRTSLIFQVKNDSLEISNFLTNNEYRLPELLKPLFIDEALVLQKEKQILFKNSGILKNIRYYNLVENDNSKSIDWGITENNFLILTTSMENAKKLSEDLEIN